MNHSGSCRRRSKFCFGHFPTNLFLLLLSGIATSARVHQELHQGASCLLGQTWSFLSQALGLEAGEHDYEPSPWPVLLRASPSASVLQVDWCLHACDCNPMWMWKKSLFLLYPEDKSQCALQAMSIWKRVSVTSREAPFPGDLSSSWGYNRRQNLRLLGTSFGCSFFLKA